MDFKDILSRNSEENVKPQPLPEGNFVGNIKDWKFGQSAKKKTDFIEFIVEPTDVGEDVDMDALAAAGGLDKKKVRLTFYVTEDSAFRVSDFLVNDCQLTGASIEKNLAEVKNVSIGFTIVHSFRTDKEGNATNEIDADISKTYAV